jgi:hypothetical protein
MVAIAVSLVDGLDGTDVAIPDQVFWRNSDIIAGA